jgi:hypothetical protein
MLAARIPDSRLHIVEGAGHLFLLDEPESVARPMRAFSTPPDRALCSGGLWAAHNARAQGCSPKGMTRPPRWAKVNA